MSPTSCRSAARSSAPRVRTRQRTPPTCSRCRRTCAITAKRKAEGQRDFIVVVSEGVIPPDMPPPDESEMKRDAFGHARLAARNIGDTIAREIEKGTGIETRATVLGHLQRGGSSSMF